MNTGLHKRGRAYRLVQAIGLGIDTSRRLADAFQTTVANISPELHRLERMGAIQRGRNAPTKVGRPCVRWRVARAAE